MTSLLLRNRRRASGNHLFQSNRVPFMSAVLLRGRSSSGILFFCSPFRTSSPRASSLHLTHSNGPLHLRRCTNPTILPPLQRQPLLPLHLPAISGIYRRFFSSTSERPSIIMEWRAERVRDAFIQYFKKKEHTFGLLDSVDACRDMTNKKFCSAILFGRPALGPDSSVRKCWNEPIQANFPWDYGSIF